jgi:hypothetical protein
MVPFSGIAIDESHQTSAGVKNKKTQKRLSSAEDECPCVSVFNTGCQDA